MALGTWIVAMGLMGTAVAQEAAEPAPAPAEEAAPPVDDAAARMAALEAQLKATQQLLLQMQAAGIGQTTPAPAVVPPTRGVGGLTFDEWRRMPDRKGVRRGDTVSSVYEVREVPRTGGIVAGASMLGSAWVISTLVAALDVEVDGNNTLWPLYIPVLGPFIAMGTDSRAAGGDLSPGGTWGLAALGAVQIAGTGVLSWAATSKKQIAVKRPFEVTSVGAAPAADGVSVSVGGTF